VHFHAYLFAMQSASGDLLQHARPAVQVCKRETIIDARNADWMEWQAGYVSGALLMPISLIRKTAGTFQEQHAIFGPVANATAEAAALIERIRSTFQVSADAARVRLTKLELLAVQAHGPSLFSAR
jgi:Zn-dependent peptidase ImmA (M78 family)